MPILHAVLSAVCREELFYKRLWEKAATHVFENIYVPSARAGTVGYVLVFILYYIPIKDLNAIQANDTTSQNENSVSCFTVCNILKSCILLIKFAFIASNTKIKSSVMNKNQAKHLP